MAGIDGFGTDNSALVLCLKKDCAASLLRYFN